MLQLHDITKRYGSGNFTVDALKGVSLNFRKSEFVSILGPSGCGKTTMLNIIGGLDKYTSGDLVINGKSTKNFTDRDWDAYRNHSIGFVFQSYNLIPHQTVLSNVELALALSGVKKAERIQRAKEALDRVGLKGMYKKRPSEMSGGQMQRVAIARAIVNNPDIILADEPTGALDTETSIQVMDILKEISKDRLVIMVTHNPDLAEKYSTRIVKMLDGLMVDDSSPLTEEELQAEQAADAQLVAEAEANKKAKGKKQKKPKMSFATSFMLSLKNLFTKRGRTVLTSFAGSIGIIGIALIFAVSQGTTNYIAAVQEETLASYPLTIEQSHTDMGSMFAAFVQNANTEVDHADKERVYEKMALYNLTKSISQIEQTENDLAAFKKYLDKQMENKDSKLYKALNGIHYQYNLDLLIYTKNDVDGSIMRSDTTELMQELIGVIYGVDLSSVSFTGGGFMSGLMSSSMTMRSLWQEMLPAPDGGNVNKLIKDQYNKVYGEWPTEKNQVMLVLDENNELDDMTLYALGLKSRAEIEEIIEAARQGEPPKEATARDWSFEKICSQPYKTIFNFECYKEGPAGAWVDKDGNSRGIFYDMRELGDSMLQDLYDDRDVGMELEVVGILAPNPKASAHMLSAGIAYTQQLTKYVMQEAQRSSIVKTQQDNPNVDIFSGKYFQNNNLTNAEKAALFDEYLDKCSNEEKIRIFLIIESTPDEDEIKEALKELATVYSTDPDQLREIILDMMNYVTPGSGSSQTMRDYIYALKDEALKKYIPQLSAGYAQKKNVDALQEQYKDNPGQMIVQLEQNRQNYTEEEKASYCKLAIEFSNSTYDDNLVVLGCLYEDQPSAISLYAVSFEAKDVIEAEIAAYNKTVDEAQQIHYTDFVGLIMSSVTTIINAITYVLIGFVSISLIVSSIMIGVITLISVQERTKEIGILRAIGASKRNVSGMFNAETVIIGFISGLLGVLVTYILTIFVNIVLHAATGIMTLNAVLPVWVALILIGISMLLTLIAGIIPSRSAAKKDPVVALRTE